jgi:hypothetical protein
MPDLWHENVQNRQGLGLLRHSPTELRRAGCSRHRDVQPFYFANHTFQASVTSILHSRRPSSGCTVTCFRILPQKNQRC